MIESVADIALVGGGYANMAATYKILQQARQMRIDGHPLARDTVHMRIFDVRHDFFGGGEAYSASSPDMMFNVPLFSMGTKEKRSAGTLIEEWGKWISRDVDHWLTPLEVMAKDGEHPALKRWLDAHAEPLRQRTEKLKEQKIPRVIFDQFMKEQLFDMIEEGKKLGIAIDLVEAEVEDIKANGSGGYRLAISEDAKRVTFDKQDDNIQLHTQDWDGDHSIEATEAVLGLGFADRSKFEKLDAYEAQNTKPVRYIENQVNRKGEDKPKAQIIKESILHYFEENGRKVKIACLGTGPSVRDVMAILSDPKIVDKIEITGYSSHPDGITNISPNADSDIRNLAEVEKHTKINKVDAWIKPRDISFILNEDEMGNGFVNITAGGRKESFDMVFNLTSRQNPYYHPLIQKADAHGLVQTFAKHTGEQFITINEDKEIAPGLYLNGAATQMVRVGKRFEARTSESINRCDTTAGNIVEHIMQRVKGRKAQSTEHTTTETATLTDHAEGYNLQYDGRIAEAPQRQQGAL
ncbi:MAG: FAD/NAD(P)-binding protein [Rickettsiales bacterium]|nr:FAD/NAD(P)-binding protein [Rickettsiales bacterium]